MPKIFISYSRTDIDFVRKLAEDLEKAGYDVWQDTTDLHGGENFFGEIPKAIRSSRFFIIILTPTSNRSEWVRNELAEALRLRKKIIPIKLIPCEVPFELGRINFVNFSTGEYTDNLNSLLSSLVVNTGKMRAVSAPEPTVPRTPVPPKHKVPLVILGLSSVVLSLILLVGWRLLAKPPAISTVTPTSAAITASITALQSPATSPTPKAVRTISPTIMLTPTPIPTEIIITLSDGSWTSYGCPFSTAPALLNSGERVEFELSAAMTEEDFGKLEWWTFVSASKVKISVGKTASFSVTQGGIIYVTLDNVTICTLSIRESAP